MGFRTAAERAGLNVLETAWEVEGGIADAVLYVHAAAAPLGRSCQVRFVRPLQRLVETKIAWPVADAFRRRGRATRAAMATGAVAAVAGAASLGAIAGAGGAPDGSEPEAVSAGRGTPAELTAATGPVLRGIAPEFEGHGGAAASAPKAEGGGEDAGGPPPAAPPPDAPPARVARSFADAFVHYEVGEADERTAAVFAAVAEKPLARALASEPPRLPAEAEVPKAEVLNVVMGERDGESLEASVSLVRLDAASELRLTLERTPEGWQVTRVLG